MNVFQPMWETGANERWAIKLASGEPFRVPGMWRTWEDEDGSVSNSFTYFTRNSDEPPLLRRFHRPCEEKRGVAILRPEHYDPSIEGDALSWTLRNRGTRRGYKVGFLNNFTLALCYQSFQRFITSFHKNAMQGWFSFDCPEAIFSCSLEGVLLQDTFFATGIRKGQFIPLEPANDWTNPGTVLRTTPFHKPLNNWLGRFFLTDREWDAVKPILERRSGPKKELASYRNLIDMVLSNKYGEIPWRKLKPDRGTYLNVLSFFHSAKKSGRLDEIVKVVQEIRRRSPGKL